MSAKKVIEAIKKYSTFLVTSHVDAEGDALGSELALSSLLRKMGKKVFIVNNERAPANYGFLPGAEKINTRLKSRKFQVAFIVDCPTKKRIGATANLIDSKKPVINVDHHMDNKKFGKVNWIDPQASSVGEMIYRLFKLARIKLDKKDALNIYTAILTDTGSFRHANTTSTTLDIASELLKLGIKPAQVYSEIYESNSVQELALVAKIISGLSFAANNQIAWVKISQDIFKKIKGKHEVLGKVLDFAKSIDTVKVVIVFCQIKQRLIKISLRSKSPVNVQKVAVAFGGGGHKLASGCTVKAGFNQAKRMVLKEVKRWTVF